MFIIDMSEWQGSVNFAELKSQADLVILRDQSGYSHSDTRYVEYVNLCKQNNIPFDTYAYFNAVSVSDAIAEANADIEKMLKNSGSQVAIIDVEKMSVKVKTDLIPAVNAYYEDLHAHGFQKVMLYSGEGFYLQNGLAACKRDGLWLAKYNANNGALHLTEKPSTPCDLWQYTSVGRVNGINTNVDLSVIVGSKPLSWFTGAQVEAVATSLPSKSAPAPAVHTNIVVGDLEGASLGIVQEYIKRNGWWFTITRGALDFVSLETGIFTKGSAAYKDFTHFLDSGKFVYTEKASS